MLHLLVVLVLLVIEGLVVVPAHLDAVLQALQTIQYCTFVSTDAHGCVSEGLESCVVGLEILPRLLASLSEDDHHEGSHKKSSIWLFVLVERSVVINLVLGILSVLRMRAHIH